MSQTYVVLSALDVDESLPLSVLVHEDEYEGSPEDYFLSGQVQEGSPRNEGIVHISGKAANALEPIYRSERVI